MGTRSLVRFFNKGSKLPLAVFYQQWDGSPSGVGMQLAQFLKKMVGVDILNFSDLGCLCAQFCAEFKKEKGGFYIQPVDSENEEYNYNVVYDDENYSFEILMIKDGYNVYKPIAKSMSLDEFYEFCNTGGCDDDEDYEEQEDEEQEDEEQDDDEDYEEQIEEQDY